MSSAKPNLSDQDGAKLTLSQLAWLLLDDEFVESWMSNDPTRVGLFKKAWGCVVRLGDKTGWDVEVVLQRLGCDTRVKDFEEDLTPRRLIMCTEYMEWVEELIAAFDLQLDKRLVLNGASRFFNAAFQPGEENVKLAKTIMAEGGLPACYLDLGEIAPAWRAATRCLDVAAGHRASRLHSTNPFVDDDTPHISPQRLKMLQSDNAAELLGENVARRMTEHLEGGCPQCNAARSRLGGLPSPSEIGSIGVLG
jgi:hypothetical protein